MNLLKGWNFSRILRVIIGFYLVGEGINSKQYGFIVFGGIFIVMAVLKIGCCSADSCSTTPVSSNSLKDSEDIIYEEVK